MSRTLNKQIHNVISTDYIKPAIPTHSAKNRYNLPPHDQSVPGNYMPLIFYYPSTFSNAGENPVNRLKKSLSETLVHYYPLAGRLSSATYVDCNDAGVKFQEVDVKVQMFEFIQGSDHEDESLFPNGVIWGNVNENSPLVVIRVTTYICGGVSIAVCFSHKLGDGKSFHTFMNSWAAETRKKGSILSNTEYSPYFISYTSTIDDNNIVQPEGQVSEKDLSREDRTTKRILFPNSKLTKLKEEVARSSGLENITRFEVLSALLYKCATTAATSNSTFFKPSVLNFPVNMRNKMIPPLPKTTIGNIMWFVSTEIESENDNNLSTLVKKMRNATMEIAGGMKKLDEKVRLLKLMRYALNNYELIWCTSLCNMQFYNVDFGWGNPIRVAMPDCMMTNNFFLMDTPNRDGIEALVSLNRQNMTMFLQDKDILEFSSSFSCQG